MFNKRLCRIALFATTHTHMLKYIHKSLSDFDVNAFFNFLIRSTVLGGLLTWHFAETNLLESVESTFYLL